MRTFSLFAIAVVVATLFGGTTLSSVARAAENCVERPTPVSRDQGRWHYRRDSVTHKRCWFLDAGKAGGSPAVQQQVSKGASTGEPAWRTAASGCVVAPNVLVAPAARWYYRDDKVTGQRCWYVRERASRLDNAMAAMLPGPAKLSATASAKVESARPKPRAPEPADRNASRQTGMAPSRSVADQAPDAIAVTFTSRWIEPVKLTLPADGSLNAMNNSEESELVPDVSQDIKKVFKADASRRKTDWDDNIDLIALFLFLGVATIIFGWIGGSFLYTRRGSFRREARRNRTSRIQHILREFDGANGTYRFGRSEVGHQGAIGGSNYEAYEFGKVSRDGQDIPGQAA